MKGLVEDVDDKDEFIEVTHVNLAATSMIVFIRSKYAHLLSNIKTDVLSLGNMFGLMANKGAVNISFTLGDHEILLINCHLEAHEENRTRRNEQWNEIADTWCLGDDV